MLPQSDLDEPVLATHPLRLLSYNLQAGITTRRYRDYLTQAWQHVLPVVSRERVLAKVAKQLAGYDIVALQEIDAGSLRTGFVDQAHYLADSAGFVSWHHQANRRLGRFAQHGIALLSRHHPRSISEHRLPGLHGRGAVLAEFGSGPDRLLVVAAHLALSRRGRFRQLDYLAELIGGRPHAVLMGDLNCEPGSPELNRLQARTGLLLPQRSHATFPSWLPRRSLDHILATPGLALEAVPPPAALGSDHLPVAARISVPGPLGITAHAPRSAR